MKSQVHRLPYKCLCSSRKPEKNQPKSLRKISSFTDEFVFSNALDEAKTLFPQSSVRII